MSARLFFGGRKVEVIAHRGFSSAAPENTLAAVRAAIEVRADRVEFDVLLTRDSVPVVFHDALLDRTTDAKGPVDQLSFAELRALDAGRWFHDRFAGERVPALEEVLAECRGRIPVNVEIKEEAVAPGTGDAPGGVEALVVEALRSLKMESQATLSSFEPRALARLRRLAPDIARQSLYHSERHRGRSPREVCAEVGSTAFNCAMKEVSPRWVAEAHRDGLHVNVYTVDDPKDMEDLICLGIDGLFTNRPDVLLEVLGRKRGRGLPPPPG